MIKKIISAGCSFTQPGHFGAWSEQLAHLLDARLVNTGSPSQGNNLIARKVIHAVEECRTSFANTDELLVAVQWSASNRFARFMTETQIEDWEITHGPKFKEKNPPGNFSQEFRSSPLNTNPRFTGGNPIRMFSGGGGWLLSNWNWPDAVSKNHIEFSNDIDAEIRTYEDILRVENYLKRHRINYFMFLGWDACLSNKHWQNPNVKYLRNMVDHSKWITSEYQWCVKNTEGPFCENLPPLETTTQHPTQVQHQMYTEGAIMPHLKWRGII